MCAKLQISTFLALSGSRQEPEMWRLPALIIMVPINISITWACYLGAKWIAASLGVLAVAG
jgi:hypothetical protein